MKTERPPRIRTAGRRVPAALLLLGGCAGAPSYMSPAGTNADALARLGWGLLVVSCIVVAVVAALVLAGALRHRREEDGKVRVRRGGSAGLRWIVAGGVVIPAVILVVVFVFTLSTLAAVERPRGRGPEIEVIGHRWWWEVRYLSPDARQVFVDANEIHVPVGTPVRVKLSSPDVIHSFWVPQLGGKMDVIPGQTNETWIEASRPGVFWGQCAEYCGLQHAHMALRVVAETPAGFARWFAAEQAPAAAPADTLAARGKRLFEAGPCAACHTVRGTSAGGAVGPDLTHFGSRRTLAAGSLPNLPENLAGWIADAQALKPGNDMPRMALPPGEVPALVAYLESLK